ncbi:hypothetical protein CTI12_AA035880 [Artemisia annua]|uniref:Uncharacterized protein n=1 Tax=Artemisia annua TaxID=35608 RepID=A0A2U1QFP0_ARTAN|nr:hypothetical protein CTI12_AA035880 [Artemisia annua]
MMRNHQRRRVVSELPLRESYTKFVIATEIYDGLVMNNLLGLLTLLTTVYIKGLSWTYSDEVLAIMIPCAIVGIFAIKRDNYPLWASISAILLYPVSVCIHYVLANASLAK